MSQPRLVVTSGPHMGTIVEIRGRVLIGRNPDSTLHLDDLQVSRKHAIIEQNEKGTILYDLGSGNGTYVGQHRIKEYRLSDGDVIRIGAQEVRFEAGTPDEKVDDSGVRFKSGAEGVVDARKAANVYETFFASPRDTATQEQLRETQKRLQAVYAANQVIASEHDLNKIFAVIMEQVFGLVPAHNGVILLKDRKTGELVTEYVRSGAQDAQITISSTIVRRAAQDGEAVITYNAADDARFEAGMSIISQNISSAMCAPLLHQDEILGVVYVDTRGTANAFTQGDLELLVALAGASAVAIKNAQYVRMLEQSYEETLVVLANAIEMRDHYTVGHTWRVTNFALEIGREMGWDETKLKECRRGGVLHDIGKIAVDDAILRKPDKLTQDEFSKMKVHPERGARLLQDVERLHPLIPYALYHHEKVDGTGYPYGLKGDEIPIEGRMLAVADVLDALTSNRPYRKGMETEKAIQVIEEGRGSHFDPECVDALHRCFAAGKIHRILQDYYKKEEKSVACPFCSTYLRIPDGAKVGDNFECNVCHRRVRLQEQNDFFFGELIPESGATHLRPPGAATQA